MRTGALRPGVICFVAVASVAVCGQANAIKSSENAKPEPIQAKPVEIRSQRIQQQPQRSQSAGPQLNFEWVGKWYSGSDVKQCRDDDYSDALLIFTPKAFKGGRELACKIIKITPRGTASELQENCAGEGETFKAKELVEVVNGKLRRTFVTGRKTESFTYNRCPAVQTNPVAEPNSPPRESPATRAAATYPVQMLGAWGGRAAFSGDDNPAFAASTCASFLKNPKAVTGDILVFDGSKKSSIGGYSDYVDTNVTVKETSPNRWEVVDRHYHDGEGGGRPGLKNITYEVSVTNDVLTLKEGKTTSRYSRCSTQSKAPEQSSAKTLEKSEPAGLIIGYENEGTIDNSRVACTKELEGIQWVGQQREEGIDKICAARTAHVNAYNKFQADYLAFSKRMAEDRRLSLATAVAKLKSIVSNCIDYKFSLTTGGHNIYIDIIPNEAAAYCLGLGTKLMSEYPPAR